MSTPPHGIPFEWVPCCNRVSTLVACVHPPLSHAALRTPPVQVLLLLQRNVFPVASAVLAVNKRPLEFLSPSWERALVMMVDSSFLRHVQMFEKVCWGSVTARHRCVSVCRVCCPCTSKHLTWFLPCCVFPEQN